MIKILRYGKRQVECPNCKALLEYEDSDIHITDYGMNEVHANITCPVCRKVVRVK